MKILHVASECYPLIKTGGLADVLGALPIAQNVAGDDARVVLPYYPQVREKVPEAVEVARRATFAGEVVFRYAVFNGVGLYLLDAPQLYERPGNPYYDANYQDYADNVFRFALLGWAAAAIATGIDGLWGRADVLHAHDWQAGLACAYLHHWQAGDIRTVFTIHNIAYQGMFASYHLPQVWLPPEMLRVEGLEFYGQMSFLKAGIYYADRVTTVSPTYADEITRQPASNGMEGLLSTRQVEGRLSGILNGVDDETWNPKIDAYLQVHFSLDKLAGKKTNKKLVQERFALMSGEKKPLLVMISRLTGQKGADLWLDVVNQRLAQGELPFQFVLLGSGEAGLEQGFRDVAAQDSKNIGVHIGYDEALSHVLMAGADAILVPSRFEPCGLTQLYGLKYGSLPLVRRTGGLADTVVDTTSQSFKDGSATGFVFDEPTAAALDEALTRLLVAWEDEAVWAKIRQNAMRQDNSWAKAAEAYQLVYR